MDNDIEQLINALEGGYVIFLEDGPLRDNTVNYSTLPRTIVISEVSKQIHLVEGKAHRCFHDYNRIGNTSHYTHSKKCKCQYDWSVDG